MKTTVILLGIKSIWRLRRSNRSCRAQIAVIALTAFIAGALNVQQARGQVISGPSMSISPTSATVDKGSTKQFTATFKHTTTSAGSDVTANATWTIEGANHSSTTISGGLLTVSASETAITLTVKASYVFGVVGLGASQTFTRTATVTVTTPTSLNIDKSSLNFTSAGSPSQHLPQYLNVTANVNWTVSDDQSWLHWDTNFPTAQNDFIQVYCDENATSSVRTGVITVTGGGVSKTVTVTQAASTTPTVSSVTVSPSTVTLAQGATRQFTATVNGTGSPSQNVTWDFRLSCDNGVSWSSWSNANAGYPYFGISSSGLLTIGTGWIEQKVQVRATSMQDNTKSGTAMVTVSNPATVTGVTVTPATATVVKGASQQFSATVQGANNPSPLVQWQISTDNSYWGTSAAGNTISTGGLLTVSETTTVSTLYVRAVTSVSSASFATATVTVASAADVTRPTISNQTITVGAITSSSIALSWTKATDNVTPANLIRYEVSCQITYDVSSRTTVTLTDAGSYTITGLNASTEYQIGVAAIDEAGNRNAYNSGSLLRVTTTAAAASISGIAISPAAPTVARGGTQDFTYTITGANNPPQTVTWQIGLSDSFFSGASIADVGIISAAGRLTVSPNCTFEKLYVKVTSVYDPTKYAVAEVTLTGAIAPTTYTLTVVSGTGGGTYAAGAQVAISANTPASGKRFRNWTSSGGGSFANANAASTTFTMPAATATVTANYEDVPPPPAISVSTSSLQYDFGGGGSGTVYVTSNVSSWTASKSVSWLTITGGTGSLNGSFTVTAAPNSSSSSRTAMITVSGGGVNAYVTVAQEGNPSPNGNYEALATPRIYAAEGTLYITLPTPETVLIYTPTGRLVQTLSATAGATHISLPRGVYIVKTPSTTAKVVM